MTEVAPLLREQFDRLQDVALVDRGVNATFQRRAFILEVIFWLDVVPIVALPVSPPTCEETCQ